MSGDHHHHHHHHHGPSSGSLLGPVLVANLVFFAAELTAGLWTGSLALLSDAGHALGDVGALAVALVAERLSRAAPSSRMSYGLVRTRVLGAFINGLALAAIGGSVLTEAIQRLRTPAASPAWEVVAAIGALGLALNVGSGLLLLRGDRTDLNLRGALVHVWIDALGSAASIVAALCLRAGWAAADPAVGALLSILVLRTAWGLLRDTGTVLLESAPRTVDVDAVRRSLAAIPGVRDVHDLHIWSLDGREALVSAHLETWPDAVLDDVQQAAHAALEADHHVHHRTLQVETTCRGGC